jgi:anthranilate synthase component 1
MITPTWEEIQRLAAEHKRGTIPITIELLADTLTPVSAFLLLTSDQSGPAFLLESVEGGEQLGRYSFIGVQPSAMVEINASSDDPTAAIAQLADTSGPYLAPAHLPRFTGGAVGWLGFEAVTAFERLPRAKGRPYGDLPDGVFGRFDTLAAFDHVRHTLTLITHIRLDSSSLRETYDQAVARLNKLCERLSVAHGSRSIQPRPSESKILPFFEDSNFERSDFEAAVERAKEYIRAGDIFQVVPSQRFHCATHADAFTIYRALRAVNPSPYMYLLRGFGLDIIGASPEMLVRVENGSIEMRPIAGTRRRGHTPEDDQRLADELLADPKERAEHLMLVDLGRNDVGRVSRAGGVQVPQFMEVERYSHVMHLVSRVVGELRPDLSPLDALRACFPAGTVSGAPKIRALEIIAELEPDQRGPYSGCVGYLGFDGSLDTAITIRTIYLQDGVAHVQAGAGVVADSVPALEWQETQNKARALLRAIELAEAMGQS